MKKIFLALLVGLLASVIACKNPRHNKARVEKSQKEKYSDWDKFLYKRTKDVHRFVVDDPIVGDIYFVKYWNTPGYYPNGEWDWSAYDGYAFQGEEDGGNVFFTSEYTTSSKKWIDEGGEKSFLVKHYFPKEAVVKDPRLTALWISHVMKLRDGEEDAKNLYKWLQYATTITEESPVRLQFYLFRLEEKIKQVPGKTNRDKVIRYTPYVLPGNPASWDAWKNPGYFKKNK